MLYSTLVEIEVEVGVEFGKMINTLSKINRAGGQGVNLNLDNVFKYTRFFFWRLPLRNLFLITICAEYGVSVTTKCKLES